MKKRLVYGILTLLLSGFIVFTSTRTGADNSTAGGVIITFINQTFFGGNLSVQEQRGIVSVGAKLLGHFSLFMVTGLFFDLFLRTIPSIEKKRMHCILLYAVILGTLGEVVQIFSAGRYPTFGDVVLDVMGFLFIVLLRQLRERLDQ